MALYTIQISEHPDAGARLPTAEAGNSWSTVFDGQLAGGAKQARMMVDELAKSHRHARAFKGNRNMGHLWYASYQM